MRVPEFLAENQVRFEELQLPPAFSATQRAKNLHVCGRQVAKCVLLMAPTGPLLAVLPATHHINFAVLAQQLSQPVRLASDEEIAHSFPDCEWGVVLPFGVLYGLPTVLDDAIGAEDLIVFESNTHVEAVRLRCGDFERLENPRRLRFARPDSP
jgi:Ala-tRNA(Pro) deacylase